MTDINRRHLVAGAACMLGIVGMPAAAAAFTPGVPELEDWIGRELLEHICEIARLGPRSLEEWNTYSSYVDFRFDDRRQLLATPSFRWNVTACLQDHMPRFFSIQHYHDLQTFQALLRAEHPTFRGLAGVPGSTVPYPSNDIWLLVAPPDRIGREKAEHAEIIRWGKPICDRQSYGDLADRLAGTTG